VLAVPANTDIDDGGVIASNTFINTGAISATARLVESAL
jgi:hypothetical protein